MVRAPRIDGDDGFERRGTGTVQTDATAFTAELPGDMPVPILELPGSDPPVQSGEYLGDFGADNDAAAIENVPPPPYSDAYGMLDMSAEGFGSRADVANDGRIDIDIDDKAQRFSRFIAPSLLTQFEGQLSEDQSSIPTDYIPPYLSSEFQDDSPTPSMNVVIQITGSRGDVQPFVALGLVLKNKYRHRVRIATHGIFRNFVKDNGLEFFNIGGDPTGLMAYMVKNPGLMPSGAALKSGEVEKRRREMYEIMRGCWRSCFEAGEGLKPATNNDRHSEEQENSSSPFVADAIIANPPSFAHIHCAERLGIPLHLMFTMPWSPTASFPHPLANIRSTNLNAQMTNYSSYVLMELLTWQGLGTLVNRFREKTLGLEPISQMWGPGIPARLKIPYTYCWSPALIPKPNDWGKHINISGFFFLSSASSYQPPDDLQAFLKGGSLPVYVGFGSIVVDDPQALTNIIVNAAERTGQRILLSKGWGGIGSDADGTLPNNVFMIGNVPHDWLFKRVSCVVHHGGAGTTAAAISAGKPNVIVPFFGDQPFWGNMIAKAGAGPTPIPHKYLTAENLAEAIGFALQSGTLEKAKEIGTKIATEDGNEIGARSFHSTLGLDSLRCSIFPDRVTSWQVRKTGVTLSALAASVLCYEGLLQYGELKLYRPKEYNTDTGPIEPVSGAASAMLGSFTSISMGILADVPAGAYRASKNLYNEKGKSWYQEMDKKWKARTTSDSLSTEDSIPENDSESTLLEQSSLDSQSTGTARGSSRMGKRRTSETPSSQSSASSAQPLASPTRESARLPSMTLGNAAGAGKGVAKVIDGSLKSSIDITMSLAQGFHNAPKLYGDDTVRNPDRIDDFQSGLAAAGKSFGLGLYDGLAGFVTQPVKGAMKDGFTGALKGFGKGLGGLVLKPGAAVLALPAYTMQGAYKEVQKVLGSGVQSYIVAARISQGYREWNDTSPEEREDAINRWRALLPESTKGKRNWYGKRRTSSKESSKGSGLSADDIRGPSASSTSLAESHASEAELNEEAESPLAERLEPQPSDRRLLDADSIIATSPPRSDEEDEAGPPRYTMESERPALPNRVSSTFKRKPVPQRADSNTATSSKSQAENEDDEMRLAMKLSMEENSKQRFAAQAGGHGRSGQDEDAEMEAAIKASLAHR